MIETVRERMGSGGPRGLQIPRSGASRVRGRFDSYAFPPLLAVWLGFVTVPAVAAEPDATAPRTPATVVAPADPSPAHPDTARRRVEPLRWSDQPRFVMLRSLVVPGWGQAHNRAWTKAALVAGAEGAVGALVIADWRDTDRLFERVQSLRGGPAAPYEAAIAEYNAAVDRFVRRQWLLGAVVLYSVIDAYVDANFRGFEIEFRKDPALPDGPPSEPSARLSYRWTF